MNFSDAENINRVDILKRFIRTLICILAFELVRLMAYLTIFVQYLFTILSGKPIEPLLDFGCRLSTYACMLLRYSMLNDNRRPFPFSNLPEKEDCEKQASTIDYS